LDWETHSPGNEFDPEVPKFLSTKTVAAYDKTGVLAYMPIQSPLMLESMGIRPGLDTKTVAATMKEFTQWAVTQAHAQGAGEIYFLGSEENTDKLAANQVFERLPYVVYRLKLKDLER
jgi:hypothetical protein